MILLSTSGTALLSSAARRGVTYAACLRNCARAGERMVGRHERVVLLAGGTRGEFREEDQLCCAWIARILWRPATRPVTCSWRSS